MSYQTDRDGWFNIPVLDSWGPRLFGIALGFAAWYMLATVFPQDLMPYPLETALLTIDLVLNPVSYEHLSLTLGRTLLGFSGAMVLGTAFGVLMGINNFGRKFLVPYVIIGLSIPAIAWAAIATLIWGFSVISPVIATILTTFPFIAVSVWKGVENIDRDRIAMAQSFSISKRRLLQRIILPDTAPALFAAVRFGLAISWKIVTIAEVFASSGGVGWKLQQSYELYQYETAWAWATLFMIVILFVEYGVFKPLERRIFDYRQDADFSFM